MVLEVCFFLHVAFIFKMHLLCDYCELSVQIYARIDRNHHNIVLYFFNVPGRSTFFVPELLLSKRSCSAPIASWKDDRTTAPTYFVMGNPFLIVPQVFGHSIYRFHGSNVAKVTGRFENKSKTALRIRVPCQKIHTFFFLQDH